MFEIQSKEAIRQNPREQMPFELNSTCNSLDPT